MALTFRRVMRIILKPLIQGASYWGTHHFNILAALDAENFKGRSVDFYDAFWRHNEARRYAGFEVADGTIHKMLLDNMRKMLDLKLVMAIDYDR